MFHIDNRWSKAEAHLHKQLITAMVALSIPLSGIGSTCPVSASNSIARAEGNIIAAVDYSAGASPDGLPASGAASTGIPGAINSGASGDASKGADAPSAETPANTGTPAAGGTAAPGGDASLDSIWNDAPDPAEKSKTKKKRKPLFKSSKSNNSAGASATGAPDGGGTSTLPASTTPPASNDLLPSSSASTAPANSSAATSPGKTDTGSTNAGGPTNPAAGANSGAGTGSSAATNLNVVPPTNASAISSPNSTNSNPSNDFGYPSESTQTSTMPAQPAPVESTPVKPASSFKSTATLTTTPATGTTSPASATETSATPANPSSAGASGANPVFSTSKTEEVVKSAPLCATRSFFQSELIRSVSWPGVGPFKGDTDPNDLADPQENKLTLQTDGDKLTSAELFLTHQPGNPQAFINLQMVMDFMLEALGARDKKINDFNSFLEKNKEKILKSEVTELKPLTTTNGPYLISIASSKPGMKEPSYLIQVKSKNATAELIRSHSTEAVRPVEETPMPNHNLIAVNVPPTRKPLDIAKIKVPVKQPIQATADTLKQEFADTIRSWQTIKKAAVKNQDPSELSKVLSGKALDKQTVAIGWLVKKKDYYDLTPKGVVVDHYEEMSESPKRYAVFAQVREMSKLIDQTTGKQLSENDDQYNVKYTIERTGDHWTINDSDLVKPGAAATTTDQTKSKGKQRH